MSTLHVKFNSDTKRLIINGFVSVIGKSENTAALIASCEFFIFISHSLLTIFQVCWCIVC